MQTISFQMSEGEICETSDERMDQVIAWRANASAEGSTHIRSKLEKYKPGSRVV